MSYTVPSTCIKYNSMPIQIYNQCVACEVQMYKDEADKYKKALEEIIAQGYGSLDYYLVAKEALKNETK